MEKSAKRSSVVENQSNGVSSKYIRTAGHLALVVLFYLIVYTIFFGN
jgi:hypothetical protein